MLRKIAHSFYGDNKLWWLCEMSIKKKVKKMNENKIVTIFLATVATIVVVFFGVVAFFSISTGSSSAKGDDNPLYIMKAPDTSVKNEPGKDQGQQGDKENQNKEEEDKVSTIASLKEMLKDEMITNEEYDKAINEEVILNNEYLPSNNNYDIYNEFAINEVCEILNINRTKLLYGGYKIYTYKDSNIQSILDKIKKEEEGKSHEQED